MKFSQHSPLLAGKGKEIFSLRRLRMADCNPDWHKVAFISTATHFFSFTLSSHFPLSCCFNSLKPISNSVWPLLGICSIQLTCPCLETVHRKRSPVCWSSLVQFSAHSNLLHQKEVIRPRPNDWSKLDQSTYPRNLELDCQRNPLLSTYDWKYNKYLQELCTGHVYLKQKES